MLLAGGVQTQHSVYSGEMQALFAEINSITDNTAILTYMSWFKRYKDSIFVNGLDSITTADGEEPNDFDLSLMGNTFNDDYNICYIYSRNYEALSRNTATFLATRSKAAPRTSRP